MMAPQLEFLEQVRHNLEYADFAIIQQAIADLRDKFLPIAKIKKGEIIDRARVNRPHEIFTSIDDVQHITDADILQQRVGFGRANLPQQSMFYGSLITPQIKLPRFTAWLETTSVFDKKPLPNEIHEVFTISRWIVKEDFDIIEMIFSDEALESSETVKRSFASQTTGLSNLEKEAHYREQGRLLSNEFARKDCKGRPDNYKISAAYTNYILSQTDFSAITYPSVPSDYQGQNIVLTPDAVGKFLELETVAMFQFDRENGHNLPVDSIKLAKDLGPNKKDFCWIDYIGKEHQRDVNA